MYTTLDDCDRDMDSNHHTADWYYGVIWAHRSIMENKKDKGETMDIKPVNPSIYPLQTSISWMVFRSNAVIIRRKQLIRDCLIMVAQ